MYRVMCAAIVAVMATAAMAGATTTAQREQGREVDEYAAHMDNSRFREVTIDGKVCSVTMNANAFLSLSDQDRTSLAKSMWIRWWYIYRRHHPDDQRPSDLILRIYDLNGKRIGGYF